MACTGCWLGAEASDKFGVDTHNFRPTFFLVSNALHAQLYVFLCIPFNSHVRLRAPVDVCVAFCFYYPLDIAPDD